MAHGKFDHTSQLKVIRARSAPPNLGHPLPAALPNRPQCIPTWCWEPPTAPCRVSP